MIYFVGDISLMDANVLAQHVRTANSILEFGTGGSTQIILQNKLQSAEYISIETEQDWIDKTATNLKALGIQGGVEFRRYDTVFTEHKLIDSTIKNKKFDVIFDDGYPMWREIFFNETFDLLKVGGVMIVHDTKRIGDLRWMFRSILERWTEIDRIDLNVNHSNMTVLHKKFHDPYVNWNASEKRDGWESGYNPPAEGWVGEVEKKWKKHIGEQDWK